MRSITHALLEAVRRSIEKQWILLRRNLFKTENRINLLFSVF